VNIIQAKLRMPPLRREHVRRPRLSALLNAGLEAKLILVSAPAGFGKTSLLCDWLGTLDLPVAWLSLDEQDNSWPRLLVYLLSSLQTVNPGIGAGLLGALESPQPPTLDRLLASLPEELAAIERPFALVLDDFQFISDAQAHDLLTFVIDNQPPGMHTVIAGRSDPPWPLAKLRASGRLKEVHAGDLRFTLEEASQLLNGALGLGLSEEDLSTLEERTEGWVVGLHLAALSLRNAENRRAFVQAFAGSDRFVLDYLMEEVLAKQEPEIRSFLLQTSLLDRFNAALCDHITGQTGSQAVLQRLEAGNLFVVPLDMQRLWFAYHSLMSSFLRSVQKGSDPERGACVHSRASEWYEANGDIVDAIQHGMLAGDYERIGQLVRSNALLLVFQGELSSVLSWLHAPSESWRRAGPWIRIAQLWAHSFSGEAPTMGSELKETREVLRAGLTALDSEADALRVMELRHGLAHLTAIEANLAVMDGRHSQAVELASQAIADLPADDSTTRRYVYVCLGMALRHQGQLHAASEALAEADAPGDDLPRAPAAPRGLATLAGIQIWMGQLDEAEGTCRRILDLHDEHLRRCGRRLPIAAFGLARLSEIMRERNRLDEALRLAQDSRSLAEQWQQNDALFESYTHLARALHANGDPASALGLLRRLANLMRERSPWLEAMTRAEEARLCLGCENDPASLARARGWAAEHALPSDGQLVFRDHAQYLTHAHVLLREAQVDRTLAQAGLNLSRKVLQLLEPTGALGLSLQASVLCMLFEAILGQTEEALGRLLECLRLGEPRGYVRLFLDPGSAMDALLVRVPESSPSYPYAQRLRQAMSVSEAAGPARQVPSPGKGVPAMEEPLSQREMDVLRLLATRLSASEIADHLFVATSTVRSHTKTIYGKLGVHTRLEAIEVARELGLI
jgi:LuxR family maltose regulon positive regulatory protein